MRGGDRFGIWHVLHRSNKPSTSYNYNDKYLLLSFCKCKNSTKRRTHLHTHIRASNIRKIEFILLLNWIEGEYDNFSYSNILHSFKGFSALILSASLSSTPSRSLSLYLLDVIFCCISKFTVDRRTNLNGKIKWIVIFLWILFPFSHFIRTFFFLHISQFVVVVVVIEYTSMFT